MTDLTSLIEKLEKAEGPDRELDCDLAFATGHYDTKLLYGFEGSRIERGPRLDDEWVEVHVKDKGTLIYSERYPAYTHSIDAAVSLAERVLPGVEVELTNLYSVARASLHHETGQSYGSSEINSLPIAICLATLRALQQKGSSNG